jgi:Uma2 family endonuclease
MPASQQRGALELLYMSFTIDDEFLPAILTAQPMTDEQFAEFCSAHPDLFLEMSAERELIVMPPNYTLTAYRHRAILTQLDAWARRNRPRKH